MKKSLFSTILCLMFFDILMAQEAIPVSFGNATGSGGTVSYSIGQVVYTTNTGTNGTSAQGVQQPFEISIVNGIEVAKEISLFCSAFPNPTKDILILKVENYNVNNFNCQLFGLDGKLLYTKKITETETIIKMINFVPATYFLKITLENKEVKVFKIIKN